ncbi:MAG: hypothetical protein A2750_03005 [Candidatus Yanofskybacteria bacterium RIFCSPHIGHO2_01_FULL_45_42]|uniref:SCP domain-containing protein n=2 Tax=Candidatus Yanofskyibacteriota TaxID=1752733 RepID=A0A1F8FKK8_9BACT|nr:MAG: hypothetical protein A2750_03005 [Candidatus Yanofskybacteria bacterium RIFCSPHIGHO2_01_FULL_45_42]OGN13581.1 MAG: hypothetical protein A3J47_02910 [Candidatus Yanofskybacteria bacterium RIFCSPHIGHO2_02_FULL_43_22]
MALNIVRKHKFVWSNRLLLANLLLLLVIKAGVSYSALPLAEIAQPEAFDRGDIIQQTNKLRSLYGYSALKENKILDRAASQRLDDMVGGNYFSHISPSGVLPWHWLEVNGYQYSYAGENLAVGFFDAESVVDAWKQSPTHRDNLLNKNYREIGVAAAPAKIKNYSGFLVVQLLASPLSESSVAGVSTGPTSLSFVQLRPETSDIGGNPIIIGVTAGRSPLYNLSRVFNRTFSLYALMISLLAMTLLLFYDYERRKELAWRAAMHLFIFAVSFGVPLLSQVSEGLIF